MGELFADIDDNLEDAFRKKCAVVFGPKKRGQVKKGLEDAIRLWLSEDQNKIVQSS